MMQIRRFAAITYKHPNRCDGTSWAMRVMLPPAYNLDRARQERDKAARADCPRERALHLEMAAIFEQRAEAVQALHG
jgi:hypothetical protein